MTAPKSAPNSRPIIIKRTKKVSSGHHGGNWKVAYADFMTAMMAFFLLLWILSVSDTKKLVGIAEYFTPAQVAMVDIAGYDPAAAPVRDAKADRPPLPGETAEERPDAEPLKDATTQGRPNPWTAFDSSEAPQPETAPPAEAEAKADTIADALAALQDTMAKGNPLESLAGNLMVARTPDGLVLEIVDLGESPMFASGRAEVTAVLGKVLVEFAAVLANTPMTISITGHTDASPYSRNQGYGNWELSADRANAARRALEEAGVPFDRFKSVQGLAEVAPLIPENPKDPRNRRITIELKPIGLPTTE